MAHAATFEVDEGVISSPVVKVNKARQYFGEKGDEGLARRLQGQEFDMKYNWNREVRKIARTDVPLAKASHDEEEERLQRERLDFLQKQTRIAEADAELARQYQQEEERLAKQKKEKDRRRHEARDKELARRLHEMEFATGASARDAGDDLETQSSSANRFHGSEKMSYLHAFAGLGVTRQQTDEDDDDLPEEERRHLLLLQDEELALAIQEHERLRALRSERRRVREHQKPQSDEHHQKDQDAPAQYTTPKRKALPPDTTISTTSAKSASERKESELVDRGSNEDANKSVTVVTSVGKSSFYKNVDSENQKHGNHL